MIIARSFARIHETNLKKQGILPATFLNSKDYELIPQDAILETQGLENLAPGSRLTLKVSTKETVLELPLQHTMSVDQIHYFKAGSALNMIAAQSKSGHTKLM
jgi:aconitase A